MDAFDAIATTRAMRRRDPEQRRRLCVHEAPVLVVVRDQGPDDIRMAASVYPAVQNLMLAARALGLGTTLTTPTSRRGRSSRARRTKRFRRRLRG
ncbi:MAG TPA: nitroreductase family protein [Candidatus Limnocylindria bacterium]|nr:nitroreductase family protein [Candidatus Limnocylindria bacterium]